MPLRTAVALGKALNTYYTIIKKLPDDLKTEFGSFYAFIGDIPDPPHTRLWLSEVSEEAARRIDVLNSPQAEVYLRVYAIRAKADRAAALTRRHHKRKHK